MSVDKLGISLAPASGTRSARDEAELVRVLFDAMPQLVWGARADGYVDYYNRRWCEYTGTTPDKVEGWAWQSVHHPDELTRVMDRWTHSLATGEPFELQLPLRRHDGIFRWFLARATPIHDAKGNLVRWVCTNTDIDDQKRTERRAQRNVTDREDLLAIVSHDLRNPLNIVLLAARQIELWASDDELGRRSRKATKTIVRAVEQMSRLVSDLLDLAKLEAGQTLPLELEKVSVSDLIQETTDLFEPLASLRRIVLSNNLNGARPIYGLCDSSRVQQVLSNLIGNALKFTSKLGSIHIAAERKDDEVVLSVKDTGIGIPDDQVRHIFKAYWQDDADRKRGAGLGLSIAKAIIDAHGGHMWVETKVGMGSTFYFTLPAANAPPESKDYR